MVLKYYLVKVCLFTWFIKPTYKSKSESQKSSIKILFDGWSDVLIKQYVNIETTCLSNPIS